MYPPVRPRAQIPDSLVVRAVAGDPLALRALLQHHGPLVWSICRRLAVDPEDSYQAIWEKAMRALPRFDPEGPASVGTWIASIAHRHLVDEHRRRMVRGVPAPVDDLVAPTSEEDPRLRRLDGALGALPENLRRVVVLHHLHGVAVDVLAEQESVPVGTVKSRLHRARSLLAATLAEEG